MKDLKDYPINRENRLKVNNFHVILIKKIKNVGFV